jgi:hypothetical protein
MAAPTPKSTAGLEADGCGVVMNTRDGGDRSMGAAPPPTKESSHMKAPFELEWLGGPAEHHFRKARPGADDLPWGTLDVRGLPPALVIAARRAWTEVALNEYRAVVLFTEVVRSLALAKAPLDVLGMASDFLADECLHVELASRMAAELGGGVGFEVDLEAIVSPPAPSLSALQRANEMVLRVSSIAEAFSGGTALGNRNVASHPLPRAIYDRILADEAHHRRLGTLYFDWAADLLDAAERERLVRVTVRTLEGLAPFWRRKPSPVTGGATSEGWKLDDLHTLGWLESARFVELARKVVSEDILGPLAAIGIVVPGDDRARLLA